MALSNSEVRHSATDYAGSTVCFGLFTNIRSKSRIIYTEKLRNFRFVLLVEDVSGVVISVDNVEQYLVVKIK